MAGSRRYSAGRLFVDVIPSFDRFLKKVEDQVEAARKKVAADDEKAAGDSAEKIAKSTGKIRLDGERRTNAELRAERNRAWAAMDREERLEAVRKEREARARRQRAARDELDYRVDSVRRAARAEAAERRAAAIEADREDRRRRKVAQARREQDDLAAWEQRGKESARRAKIERDRMERDDLAAWERTAKNAADQAKVAGGRFGQEIRRSLREAMLDLPDIEIDADSTRADRKIRTLRGDLQALSDKTIRADFDGRDARREIRSLEREAGRLSRTSINIQAKTNARSVQGVLRDLRTEIDAGSRSSGKLSNRHRDNQQSALDGANAFRAFNIVILAGAVLVPVLIPAIAGLAAVVGGLIPILLGAATGLGVMLLAFSGIGEAAKQMGEVQKNAARDTLAASKTMRNAARGVRDAEQGMATARRSAAQAAVDSARRVKDAQIGVADAQTQSAEAIQAALGRVKDAQDSVTKAQARATEMVKVASAAQRNAQEGIADAQERSAQRIEDALRRQSDARRGLTDAQENAVSSVEAALRRQENAERSIARAQESTRQSILDLTQARRDAAEQIEDLRLSTQRASLGVEDAALGLERARIRARQAGAVEAEDGSFVPSSFHGGPAASLDQREAVLGVRQAQLSLQEAKERNKDVQEEAAAARKAGIEGSELVLTAKKRLLDAQREEIDQAREAREAADDVTKARVAGDRAIADARRDLADASKAVTTARVEGAESIAEAEADAAKAAADLRTARVEGAELVADAEKSLAEASKDLVRARTDGARRVRDAEQGVTDALEDQRLQGITTSESLRDAQERLTDSQEAYREALEQTSVIGSASMQALTEAMDNLSPAGQRFAKFLFGLSGYFKELRFAAQEGMLPGVQTFMEDMVSTYGPSFLAFVGKMSAVLGEFFEDMSDVFKGDVMQAFFATMDKYAPIFTRQVGDIILELLEFVAALATAFAPFGVDLGEGILSTLQGWTDWAEGLKGNPKFEAFLEYVKKSAPPVLDMLVAFGRAIINVGIGLAPYADKVVAFFTDLFDQIANADPDLVGKIAAGLLTAVIALQSATGIMSGLTVARLFFSREKGGGFANPFALMTLGAVLLGGAVLVLREEWDWFRDVTDKVAEALKTAGEYLWEHRDVVAAITLVVGGLYAAWRIGTAVMVGYKAALAVLTGAKLVATAASGGLSTALTAVRVAMLGISWPIVAIIAGITLLVGALVWLYRNNEDFANFVDKVWAGIKAAFFATISWITDVGFPAVAAAFWWLYNNVVLPVVGFIVTVWNGIKTAFFATINWITGVGFPAISAAFWWLYNNGVMPVVNFIVAAWNLLFETVMFVWNRWGKPIMDDIFAAFEWFLRLVTKDVLPVIQSAWNTFVKVLRLLWDGLLWPLIESIGSGFMNLWNDWIKPALDWMGDAFTALWKDYIKPALDWIGDAATDLWKDYIEPAFNLLLAGLVILGDGFMALWEDFVVPAFEEIGAIIEAVWQDVIKPVFDFLEEGVNNIAEAFDAGESLIDAIWIGIGETIAGPLRAALRWVKQYFIDPLNLLLSAVGLDWLKIPFPSIPESSPVMTGRSAPGRGSRGGGRGVGGYADGGVLPGYRPGHDDMRFVSSRGDILDLSGGEPILRPEVGRVLGKNWVDGVNNAARGGGVQGVQGYLGGFAGGGMMPRSRDRNLGGNGIGSGAAPVQTGDALWKLVTTVAEFIADPVKVMKDLIAELLEGIPAPGAVGAEFVKGTAATLAAGVAQKVGETFTDTGPKGASGTLRAGGSFGDNRGGMGWRKQVSIAKDLMPGIRVTDTVRPGGSRTASGAISYHSRARAADFAGTSAQMGKLFHMLVAGYGKSSPEIYYGPGGAATRWGNKHFLTGVTARTHPFNHVHWAHKDGGMLPESLNAALAARARAGFTGAPNVGIFDGGGKLNPGDISLNLGRAPERITTESQWAKIEAAALRGGGQAAGERHYHAHGPTAEEMWRKFQDWERDEMTLLEAGPR